SRVKSCPATSTWPELAASRPAITIKSDDFPDPLGPVSATDWPSSTVRSMPRKISTGPARLLSVSVTAFRSMTGEGLRCAPPKDGTAGEDRRGLCNEKPLRFCFAAPDMDIASGFFDRFARDFREARLSAGGGAGGGQA